MTPSVLRSDSGVNTGAEAAFATWFPPPRPPGQLEQESELNQQKDIIAYLEEAHYCRGNPVRRNHRLG